MSLDAVGLSAAEGVPSGPAPLQCRAPCCGAIKTDFCEFLVDLSRKNCWHVMCICPCVASLIKGLSDSCWVGSVVREGQIFLENYLNIHVKFPLTSEISKTNLFISDCYSKALTGGLEPATGFSFQGVAG
jgi:hypothetical protein